MVMVSLPLCDGENVVADTLERAVVRSGYKQSLALEKTASPVSSVYLVEIEQSGIDAPKNLSCLVPNLHIPDYGSSMTSSVYMRGFGSRIDNPVIGMYIDDIPVLNKNSYDMDLLDIRKIDVFRGPQGTLYGRNSLCGVLSLSTVSPSVMRGGRASLEYGSANTFAAKVSYYGTTSGGAALGGLVGYRRTDGLYTNVLTGRKCDPSDAFSLRLKTEKSLTPLLEFENILSVSMLDQGGWPYGYYDESFGTVLPVAYNDYCGYKRLNVTEGVKFRRNAENFRLSSVTSWQMLLDRMDLDQDFTPASMFTLTQIQRENALTQELILTPEGRWKNDWWDWQTGFFAFGKYNAMSAPVRFKQDGINELITGNANENIPDEFGDLEILETSFPIRSDFGIFTGGVAVYHESYFSVGKWLFTAGLRLDYEGSRMSYDSNADISYRLTTMPGFRPLSVDYRGVVTNGYFEAIPKLSVLYDMESASGKGGTRIFAVASKGYKSGGFNTQIFSDILQNTMMSDMMSDLGVYLDEDTSAVTAENTTYAPETSWNYELGMNFGYDLPGRSHRINGAVSVFYIDCRNQQITIFPPGKSTGRMMANVGRSRSCGMEAELGYMYRGFGLAASAGYTDARFVFYDDGHNDNSGNRIPYSPEFTVFVRASYTFGLGSDIVRNLNLAADLRCTGRVWWNETNTLSQAPYMLLGADMSLDFKWFDLFFRGENLTGTVYDTFYFMSVGNSFFQRGKPFKWSAGVSIEF